MGVYTSGIHGRGLFCKREIQAGEMVIEYAGEIIRAMLTDKRENIMIVVALDVTCSGLMMKSL